MNLNETKKDLNLETKKEVEKSLSINTSSKKIKYSLKSNIISCYN